jgi:hypothetical protein
LRIPREARILPRRGEVPALAKVKAVAGEKVRSAISIIFPEKLSYFRLSGVGTAVYGLKLKYAKIIA